MYRIIELFFELCDSLFIAVVSVPLSPSLQGRESDEQSLSNGKSGVGLQCGVVAVAKPGKALVATIKKQLGGDSPKAKAVAKNLNLKIEP